VFARWIVARRPVSFRAWRGVVVVLPLSLALSCRNATRGDPQQDIRASIEIHGSLKRTFETRHDGLRRELARLVGEQATPSQMTSNTGTIVGSEPGIGPIGVGPPRERNAATGMIDAIPDALCRSLQRRFRDAYPESVARIADASGHAAWWRLLDAHVAEITAYRNAVFRPECDFGLRFTHGLLLDATVFDRPLVGNRLLALSAIRGVVEDRVADAIGELGAMFRAIEFTAGANHMTARVAAARMRSEALRVVAFLAESPFARDADLQAVHALLARHIGAMPAESGAWRGERAIGLHAYEMARAGQWLSLLPHGEFSDIRSTGIESFGDGVLRHVDDDEWCYLRIMRDLVDLARRPYHERRARLDAIRGELDEPMTGGGRPVVAKRLLDDVEWIQRAFAREQAMVDGWRLAFTIATGNAAPADPVNPATGRPFAMRVQADHVTVWDIDLPEDAVDRDAMGRDTTAMMRWFRVSEPIRVRRIAARRPSTVSSRSGWTDRP